MTIYDTNIEENENTNAEIDFLDFNDAEDQHEFGLIPKGTLAKVVLTITPGGYNDPARSWTGGYASKSHISDAVFLKCEFTVLEGEYSKCKAWGNIGLYSSKNDNRWGKMGNSFICGILDSARGWSFWQR